MTQQIRAVENTRRRASRLQIPPILVKRKEEPRSHHAIVNAKVSLSSRMREAQEVGRHDQDVKKINNNNVRKEEMVSADQA